MMMMMIIIIIIIIVPVLCVLQLSDLESHQVQAALRRDSCHVSNSYPSSTSDHFRHHHCPVMSRLYLPPADDDAGISRGADAGDSRPGVRHRPELVECRNTSSMCDDVFWANEDDDDGSGRRQVLFHAWAQYRIAQRGIMVSLKWLDSKNNK